jgi:hypothetical protein
MRSVTYSLGVSLDGYIVGPDGNFDWTVPDEEVEGGVLYHAAGGSGQCPPGLRRPRWA